MTTSSLTAQVWSPHVQLSYHTCWFLSGQIELYTHFPFLPSLVRHLSRMDIRTCAVYLIESQFMEDKYKFFRYGIIFSFKIGGPQTVSRISSGVLSAMSAMVNLEVPWINIMSKMDLVTRSIEDPAGGRNGIRAKKDIARSVVSDTSSPLSVNIPCVHIKLSSRYRYLEPDPLLLVSAPGSREENKERHSKFHALNQAIVQLVCILHSSHHQMSYWSPDWRPSTCIVPPSRPHESRLVRDSPQSYWLYDAVRRKWRAKRGLLYHFLG